MRNPFISPLLEVRRVSRTKFGVFAKDLILSGTLIESCAMVLIPKKLQGSIQTSAPALSKLLYPNPDEVLRERSIAAQVKELELERRLDAGLLTQEEVKNILVNSGHLKAVLDLETSGFLLGFGSIYQNSDYPNTTVRYDDDSKLYDIVAVQDIQRGQEITRLRSK